MGKYFKKRSKKKGLAPGTMVHIGEPAVEEKIIFSLMQFDGAGVRQKDLKAADEIVPFKDQPGVIWVNIDGLQRLDLIEEVGKLFGLHPLVMEDIVNTDQRPKLEDYGDYIYIVMKMIYPAAKSGEVVVEQISLVLGKKFVITFQEKPGDVFDYVRERIRNDKGRIRKEGADYLAYSLIDAIIDNYFGVMERQGEEIEDLEDALVKNPSPAVLHRLHNLKRENIFLRKAFWPLREVIGSFQRFEAPLLQPSTRVYLRDIYDHSIQLIDTLETYRDMLSSMIDIYLSSVSNRMNEVMKVLTIIATIFIPLTFIVGVYGMNFKYMPEINSMYGYPAVLAVMLLISLGMLVYFKRKKWI